VKDCSSPLHILLIIGIALLLFGPSKFADLGKGLGEGIRNFKSAMKDQDVKPDVKTADKPQDPPSRQPHNVCSADTPIRAR